MLFTVQHVFLRDRYSQFQSEERTAINLFINSDAILNRDALWSIQGKKQYLQSCYRWRNTPYRKNIAMNVFLVTMGICQSIF